MSEEEKDRIPEQAALKAEARSQHAEPQPEQQAQVSPATMNKILQGVPRIPLDRLRLMLADDAISPQEARAALALAGLSREEIEEGLEFARRVIQDYAARTIPPEERLTGKGKSVQSKVEAMKALLVEGLLMPVMKKVKTPPHRVSETEGVGTQGMAPKKEPEGKTLL